MKSTKVQSKFKHFKMVLPNGKVSKCLILNNSRLDIVKGKLSKDWKLTEISKKAYDDLKTDKTYDTRNY